MNPTHRCNVCGSLWRLNPGDPVKYPPPHPFSKETWSLFLGTTKNGGAGDCCDNVEMGKLVEALP